MSSHNHPVQPLALFLSHGNKAQWRKNPPRHFSAYTNYDQLDPETDSASPVTLINVFSSGYCHFQNLYVFNGTFYIVTKASMIEHPETEPILTLIGDEFRLADCFPPNTQVRIVTIEELEKLDLRTQYVSIKEWDSNTFISIQTPGFAWLPHYAHLVEDMLAAWIMLQADVENRTPSFSFRRLLFLGDPKAEKASSSYMFQNGTIAQSLVTALFNETSILGASSLRQYKSIRIDSAMTSCRVQAYNNDVLAQRYRLMLVGLCHVLWSTERIRQFQLKVYQALHIVLTPLSSTRPVLLYIDRQNTGRRLVDSVHNELLARLSLLSLEGWNVLVKKTELLSFHEQISISSRANVIIGVHGNGLSNVMWMQPGACLIEFHSAIRRFNFPWLAQVVGADYVPIDEDGIQWVGKYVEAEENFDMIKHRVANITINPRLVIRVIRSWRNDTHTVASRLWNMF